MIEGQVRGIDVSKWQGPIAWPSVKAAGIDFAIVKATEGSLAPGTSDAQAIADFGLDPTFRQNWAGARAAGLVRGAYHFGRPDLGNEPEWEADWFLSVVNPATLLPGDMLALDLEMGAGDLGSWAARFLGRVFQAAGYPPLFYSSPNFMATRSVNFPAVHGSYGLWLALWPAAGLADGIPAPVASWPVVAFWQYGSGGTVAGIGGRVDGDVFNGDLETLAKYGKAAPPSPIPPPPPIPTAAYAFHVYVWSGEAWVPNPAEPAPAAGTMTLSDAKHLADRWWVDRLAQARQAAAGGAGPVGEDNLPADEFRLALAVVDPAGGTAYAVPHVQGRPQP